MALRVALNKAKPLVWGCGYQLVRGNFGFLGVIGHSSVVGSNSHRLPPASFNQSSLRHYFLPPPPPPVNIAEDSNYQFGIVSVANDDKDALAAADFAVRMIKRLEETNMRFERLVRASASRFAGSIYYLTLEATDEKGDLNIYYAVVLDLPSIRMKRVIRWQLVDESFSYPFRETRWSEVHKKDPQEDSEVNDLMRAWLMGVALQSKDDRTYVEYFDFGENSQGIVNFCPPWAPKKKTDPFSIFASDRLVPVDIEDSEKIHKYASSAVEIYNEKKGGYGELHLDEVLCASRSVVDSGVFYLLLFKVNGSSYDRHNIYSAIIKVLQAKVELMMFQEVNEFFADPLSKDPGKH